MDSSYKFEFAGEMYGENFQLLGDELTEMNSYPHGLGGDLPSMDLILPTAPTFPVSPVGPPERYPITHPAEFTVQINSTEIKKKKYLYSHSLNRIYVGDNTPVCVEFQWNQNEVPSPMYVRATTVFADDAQAQKRVETCVQHNHGAIASGKSEVVARNVLVSSRVDVDNSDVYYCGDPNNQESWMSVLVKFFKPSDAACRHAYQFVCKNSCTSGINRRAIDIIFTLENEAGRVFGRQCVGARACACPNRDMRRDEAERDNELAAEPQATPLNRKRRLDPSALNMPVLPPLPIVSLKAVDIGLAAAIHVMEYDAPLHANDPQTSDNYKKCIAAFKKYREDLKKPPPSS